MKIKYTNLLGLIALVGTITGFMFAGIFLMNSLLLSIPFVLLGIVSLVIFVKFLYHFVMYSPYGDIPYEEAREAYMDDDDIPYKKE